MNVGIEKASGKYLCFVDIDDYIDKEMIRNMKSCIDKEKVDLVRVNYYKVTRNRKKN